MKTAGRRLLIISAAMGTGHDQVAAELARRLAAQGAEVEIIDVLRLLPMGLGPLLRHWYHWMITRAPWLYEVIYRVFFVGKRAPSTSPLTVLAGARLRRLVSHRQPDEVISAFHLAAQVTGRLRGRGELPAPSTVLVTDFAVHRLWLHPGNDRYLCPNPAVIPHLAAVTGRPSFHHAPVVRPEFLRLSPDPPRTPDPSRTPEARPPEASRTPEARPPETRPPERWTPGAGTSTADRARIRARVGDRIGAAPGERLVLVSAGSWGVGEVARTARILARSGRYTPVILCGRNDGLRRRLTATRTGPVLGWQEDMPELMSAAYALVDNAAGLTCEEAFAAGLPVVSYRPIPGHGRDGALAMARAGVSAHARTGAELLDALDRLTEPRRRQAQTTRASALFLSPPAESRLISAPLTLGPRVG
ncbi:MGDG synthase family glycosyltransferase [Nonomuraea cavernae]|uniref:MGDG synthase family glycosyltransferase n=1 Tax=Nonomuraea cavernae TaxID=2045107 RepID=UPI0033E70C33